MESYTDSLVTQGLLDKEPEPAAVRGWRSRGLEPGSSLAQRCPEMGTVTESQSDLS